MTDSEKKEIQELQAKMLDKLGWIIAVAAVMFGIWIFFIKGPDIDRSLREHAKYTTAYIKRVGPGTKGKPTVTLVFEYNGEIYIRGVRYRPRVETFSMQPIRAGDSCVVAFDSLHPRYCTIYKDFKR